MNAQARASSAYGNGLVGGRPLPRFLLTLIVTVAFLVPAYPAQAAQVGFKAHSYDGFDATSGGPVTGEKPESKLWNHDGTWWAAMVSPAKSGAHTIHRLDAEQWVDTGVVIDALASSKEDVLSVGNTLYVTSRNSWELHRFTYANGAYRQDPGFPVSLPVQTAEALTLARDSQGTLWITWEQSGKVMVARSQGSGTTFGSPFVVPVSGASNLNSDDISSAISFSDNGGPTIGVMWSNQTDRKQYFAVHRDGAPDGSWSVETALSGPNEADDHLNLKTAEGKVFAVTKTSVSDVTLPIIRLLVRSPGGSWSKFPVALYTGTNSLRNTRPITELLIDASNRDVYVFMTKGEGSAARGIEYKKSSLDTIAFPSTATPFIVGGNNEVITDATSAKQVLTTQTGIVVLASDGTHYWWNRLGGTGGGGGPSAPVADFAGSPASGQAPLAVTFTDRSSGSPTSWSWDFGDGETSTQQNPSHTYQADGTYTVALTAANATGSDSETKAGYVTVGSPGGGTEPITLTPVADAYVRSDDPNRNFGKASDLRVRSGSKNVRTYLRFDVTGLSGPATATLRLFVTDPSPSGGTVNAASNSWTETGITFSNSPVPQAVITTASATTNGTFVEIDLGTIDGNGTYSYVITGKSTDLQAYSSRSGANPPRLVLTPS